MPTQNYSESTHAARPASQGLLICDFGSQYTLLIARKLRELGVYAEVIDAMAAEPPQGFAFEGLILSGSPDQVGAQGRGLAPWILAAGKPVLGICYGLQLLVHALGGEVRSGQKREYGPAELQLDKKAHEHAEGRKLFAGLPESSQVWMSHGDDLGALPPHFSVLARSGAAGDGPVIAAIAHDAQPIFGLQFHPEVEHSQWGQSLLANFATQVCKLAPSYDAGCMLTQLTEEVRRQVGPGKVVLGISGGVDSAVAAALLTRALGPEKVLCVLVDHGFMRAGEVEAVSAELRACGLHIEVLERAELFLSRLEGVGDPEKKRKIIGLTFIECFEAFAKESGDFTHLGQGTLYPDVIESAGHGVGAKVIKSHHNVGGLPERMHLKLVEPLRFLFKDEVRALGAQLGLPASLTQRHPFPGPGLAIRLPGAVDREKLAILKAADKIFMDALVQEGLYAQVWQAGVILLPVKAVGVMGDERSYQWACVLRAVTSSDAMTAEAASLPFSFLSRMGTAIVAQVPGINRVLYDVTHKPPATIEWE